jgi:2-methylcitrate dehydratase PrpD
MSHMIETMADLVCSTRFEAICNGVQLSVSRSFLDTLGVTLSGSREDAPAILFRVYEGQRDKGECTLLGLGGRASAETAALINGVSAHILDYDDAGAATQGHPSVSILPCLWALSEKYGATGKDFISAYTAGVELFSRLARALPFLHLKGWHPTSVLGVLAATAAGCRLLNCPREQVIQALAISTSLASGLVGNFGTMTKSLQVGHANRNAIMAIELARLGFTGSVDVMDKDCGFLHAVFWGQEHALAEQLSQWGRPFALVDPGVSFKLYPCCALSHRSIDMALEIMATHSLDWRTIDTIICRVTPRAAKVLNYRRPNAPLEGKFCMPFLLSCAFRYGRVSQDLFSEETLADVGINELMTKVDFRAHENWVDEADPWRPDRLFVGLCEGGGVSAECVYPKGHRENPITDQLINEKFKQGIPSILSPAKLKSIMSGIIELPTCKNVGDLIRGASIE